MYDLYIVNETIGIISFDENIMLQQKIHILHFYIFTLLVFSATINIRKILTFNFP